MFLTYDSEIFSTTLVFETDFFCFIYLDCCCVYQSKMFLNCAFQFVEVFYCQFDYLNDELCKL